MLDKIIGHKAQKSFIMNAMTNNRMTHGYIFYGVSGTGKKLFASELAKTLICLNRKEDVDTYCNDCSSCHQADSMTNPDIMNIEPDGEFIKTEQIRQLKEKLCYTSFYGKYRMIIIDNAEKLNEESGSALLKTLEEPFKNVVFVLVVSNIHSVLNTIKSRCQTIRFGALKTSDVFGYLVQNEVCNKEAAEYIADISEGSIGNALRYVSGNMESARERVNESLNKFRSDNILIDYKVMIKDMEESKEFFLDILMDIFRKALVIKYDPKTTVKGSNELPAEYSAIYDENKLASIIQEINKLKRYSKNNINIESCLNSLLLTRY